MCGQQHPHFDPTGCMRPATDQESSESLPHHPAWRKTDQAAETSIDVMRPLRQAKRSSRRQRVERAPGLHPLGLLPMPHLRDTPEQRDPPLEKRPINRRNIGFPTKSTTRPKVGTSNASLVPLPFLARSLACKDRISEISANAASARQNQEDLACF